MSKRTKIIILISILIPVAILGITFGYFFHKIWSVSKVISFDYQDLPTHLAYNNEEQVLVPEDEPKPAPPKEENKFNPLNLVESKKLPERGTENRINILLLGKASDDYPGSNLTDTIILASVNPKTYQGSLLSIPRDLFVNVPDTKNYTKINSIYAYGLRQGGHQKGMELLKRAIGEVTGQKIDYYVMVDFKAFEKLIDSLGGVDVTVEKDIFDNRYPGPNYSYQTFAIKQGTQHLDGSTALKYVRVRHTEGGDFGRAKRQQQILESIKAKFFEKRGITEGLSFFSDLLEIIKDNVKTDTPFSDYLAFLMLIKEVNIHQVVNKVLDNSPEGVLENYSPVVSGIVAYTLRPKAGNYYQIQRIANFIFDLGKMDRQDKARITEKGTVSVFAPSHLAYYKTKVENFLRTQNYQVLGDDFTLETIHLWERAEGSKLPTLSRENHQNISSDSLITKLDISPENLNKTVIYDNASGGKPFTLDDLIRRLGAQVSLFKENQSQADFVVIIGDNVEDVFQNGNENFFLTEEGANQEKMNDN